MTTYNSLEEFYAADPRRLHSFEADYGRYWTNGQPWPRWRVSYIRDTGEVYAEWLGYEKRVEVLGVVPPDKPDKPGGIWYHTLDRLLAGWADENGRPLSWVSDRLNP